MSEGLRAFVEEAGPVVEVRGAAQHIGVYESLAFVMSHGGCLALRCDRDTDEVLLAVEPGTSDPSLAKGDALRVVEGSVIEYAWTMTNHRGYFDAFQLRFLDLKSRKEICWQFEIAASSLHARVVET